MNVLFFSRSYRRFSSALFQLRRVSPVFRQQEEQPVNKPHHELGIPPGPTQRGEQVLHRLWPSVALHCLPLQGHGVRGSGREGLGRRAERLQMQHSSAWMPQCLLRPLLPRVPRPAVGPAAHLCHLPLSPGGDARGLQGGQGTEKQAKIRRKLSPSLQKHWQEARRPVVDLRPQFGLQSWRRCHLCLPSLPHLRGL